MINRILLCCTACLLWLSAWVQQPLAIGQILPNFQSVTIKGDTFELAKQKGNIVLVDCWASWNISSRKHNLSTKRLYEKIRAISLRKKIKFTIVQISLDTREDLLLTAISKDNLYWRYHICDYQGWKSAYVNQFNINTIPTNYLLDTAGVIIAQNIWEKALEEKVQSLIQ